MCRYFFKEPLTRVDGCISRFSLRGMVITTKVTVPGLMTLLIL